MANDPRLTEAELLHAYRDTARTGSGPEDELLDAALQAAGFLGWRAHHVRRSDRALQQGAPGFPDLILARPGELLALELKSAVGRPTSEQSAWLQLMDGATVSAYLVRPADLDGLIARLRRSGA